MRHDYSPERGTKSSLSNSAGGLKESHFRPERHDISIVIIARRTVAKLSYCDPGPGNSHVGIAATWAGCFGTSLSSRQFNECTQSTGWPVAQDEFATVRLNRSTAIANPRPTPPVSRLRDSSRR